MINDSEILNDIKEIRKKTELLVNPMFNDYCESALWKDINKRLKSIEENIENNFKLFNIN